MGLSGFNPARRRLAVALGLSVLLHAWLMESRYGKGAARSSADGAPVVARLLPAAEPAKISLPDQAMQGMDGSKASVLQAVASPAVPKVLMEATGTTPARFVTEGVAVQLQPSDPTYYAAGDLDVFPKAWVKPDLNAALAANHEPAAGKVRATVLIDEAGVVNAVRGVDAAASDIETVVRELLLRTRFTPARNKDGRIVKAQVLVALDYDTRAASASR